VGKRGKQDTSKKVVEKESVGKRASRSVTKRVTSSSKQVICKKEGKKEVDARIRGKERRAETRMYVSRSVPKRSVEQPVIAKGIKKNESMQVDACLEEEM